jgi:hypothetical protein
MSLPLQWVDRIFDKLALTYGQAFLGRWRDLDMNSVKSDWCHELAQFERLPHRIAYALANLPEAPPSVATFKALCRQAPAPETTALPEPKADPARVKAELAKLADMRAVPTSRAGNRDWAHRIIARHEAGQKISPTVLQMARAGAAA